MFDSQKRYELLVRPLGRTPADEYYHNGSVWIEGREGNSYVVDLRNNTSQRALFILSVDGLDVLSGNPAGPNSSGYVIAPYTTISVPGWKLNNQQAAEFFFSRSKDSYVNSIGGSTANTGVIGAMIFSEAVLYTSVGVANTNPIWWPALNTSTTPVDVQSTSTTRRVDISKNVTAAQNYISQEVGTGFGNSVDWNTSSMTFQRSNPTQPDTILAVYYNTAKNLEKMGIQLRSRNNVGYMANPFPTYSSSCQPPPGWYKK